MPLLKRNPFGHILLLKKLLIRFFGLISHNRYRKFNSLNIEGSEILRNLPDSGVLFISNTYKNDEFEFILFNFSRHPAATAPPHPLPLRSSPRRRRANAAAAALTPSPR